MVFAPKSILSSAATGLLALICATSAQAQEVQATEAVAATVNDEMISTFDVSQRMRLMLLTSGGRIPESAYPQLQKRALQDLVDEKVKLQEAGRLEFQISPEQVEEEFGRIAASVGATIPQLEQQLLSQQIAPSTLRDQLRSRLVWQRLVAARYRDRVRVSDEEVDEVMDRLMADTSKEQYLISEICLPIEDNVSSQEIYNAGMQMIEQMRNGVPFDALARQFSYCTSAANGGDRGWTSLAEMEPELATVVEKLNEGSVSIPTPHDGMMHIMAVRSKREPKVAGTKTYEVAYAGAPLYVGEQTAREAFAKLNQTNVCAGTGELSIDLGSDIGVTLLSNVPEDAMELPFRAPVGALERGEVSDVITTANGYHALLLCAKDEGLGLPPREAIEDKLFADQLELISRRYLRDLKRDSAVDMRLTSQTEPTDDNS